MPALILTLLAYAIAIFPFFESPGGDEGLTFIARCWEISFWLFIPACALSLYGLVRGKQRDGNKIAAFLSGAPLTYIALIYVKEWLGWLF